MGNTIIVLIILAIVTVALLRFRNHFRGGGCCGSRGKPIRSHKKLDAPAIGQWVLTVEGMHCESCQARIENAVNRLNGAVCTVNLKKKTATVAFSQPVGAQQVQQIIEKLGYSVSRVQ